MTVSSIHQVPQDDTLPEVINESLPTVNIPTSDSEVKVTPSPASQIPVELTSTPSSEAGVDINSNPSSEIDMECSIPLSSETEVKIVCQNNPFATESTINQLPNHFTLPEVMNDSLLTVHPSSQKSSETGVKFSIPPSPQTEFITHPSSETKKKLFNQSSSQTKIQFTSPPPSETGVDLKNDPPSKIETKSTRPLSYETEVSQNVQFASKDMRYGKTGIKKSNKHRNESIRVVKKKVSDKINLLSLLYINFSL